jgi:hypothetical protein
MIYHGYASFSLVTRNIQAYMWKQNTIYLISLFFLFGSTWERLCTHSKQLEYYFSEKNRRDFKFGYFIPWRGCFRQPNSPSRISHEIFSDSDRLLFKVPFFLVKIFIYFKQQIHEINSFKKLEWLILKFCRKLSFISSIYILVFLLEMFLFFTFLVQKYILELN